MNMANINEEGFRPTRMLDSVLLTISQMDN